MFRNSKEIFKKYNDINKRYVKADLEQIVSAQQEILNSMHGLFSIIKHQNESLNSNKKELKYEVTDFKQKLYPTRK